VSRFSQPRIGAADGFFVVTFPMSPGTLFDWHVHEDHQLPLLASGEVVSRIAARVGYETPSAFIAAFRRETGTTPAAYFGRT
jgi:AraC-like DNA-binding protein